MPIISLLGNKGGAGKTTLAVNLASALNAIGSTLLLDADPQQSSSQWRVLSSRPNSVSVFNSSNSVEMSVRAQAKSYKYLLIDCPPSIHSNQTKEALRLSDWAIIPVLPSPLDLWASVKIEDEIKKAKDNIQRHKARIDTLQSQIEELQESVKDHDKLQKKLGKVSVIESSLETKIRRLKDDILFYETNDQCPTCSQSLTAEFKKKAIEGKNSKLSEAVKGMEELGKEYEKIKTQVSEMSNVNGLVTSKQSLISSEHGNINAMNNYIEKLGDENKNISNDRKDIGKENKKLSTLVTSLANQNKSQEELTNDKQMYEVAAMMLRDQGIKTKIIKQYVPIMNKLINKYLAAMDFFVDFQLDENFVEVIKSRHRDEFTYDSFSEGEKMRIDLALLFTWRAIARMKNSTNTNLLILDEVFDASLDNNGCDEFLKILHQLGNDQNVFVISHKGDILSDKFRSTIRFEKHKNFSRIAS